jgi:MscS family membrane protein
MASRNAIWRTSREGKPLTVVGTLFSKWRRETALVVLLGFACGLNLAAQTSLLPGTKTAAPQQAAAQVDPLGRETPHGTVIGFIRAAQEENGHAPDYFQAAAKGRRTSAEEEKDLADHLVAVLNARFAASQLDKISREPDGRGDDGQPSDQVSVPSTRGEGEPFQLSLVRIEQAHGNKLWYISRQTLEQVPEAYDSLTFPIEKRLPAFLVKSRLLGMPLWQWLTIILLAPVALAVGWFAAFTGRLAWRFVRRLRGLPPLAPAPPRRFGPDALLIAVLVHYVLVEQIGVSLLYQRYYEIVVRILSACAVYWAVIQVTNWIFQGILRRLTQHGRLAEKSLVSLARRVLDVTIFFLIGLLLLESLDVNVTAALAGLGIGGLAIGLGAQKTFENLLGGISILTDKAIVVGDSCKIGDQAGVVEDIGLRSTKLRTENRTVVSIPNGTVATATLENFRFRDKILCKQLVRLRYDLSPDHIRYALAQLYETLVHHPKVEEATARARFLRFGDNGIEVEIYAYILERDFAEFLATQEDLLLQVMDTLEKTGAAVALPTQTTMVTQDKWVDPEKAMAAQRAIEKTRDPGVPGSGQPELAPDDGAKKT